MPESGLDWSSISRSCTNSFASKPAFSAIVIGKVLKAFANASIAIASLPLIDFANF